MTLPPPANSIDNAYAETVQSQSRASDPTRSVWVTANAGTGKTYVLTRRVLRLLLAGTAPERILCLTYTKAAAAEMSKRVFDALAEWVAISDENLDKKLRDVLDRDATVDERALARTLFTAAIETPGGFKVQTIHAFAERLLQRFPLEAGVPAGFAILDDLKGRELKARAIDGTLQAATDGSRADLRAALETVVRFAADTTFDALIGNAMQRRDVLEAITTRADAEGITIADFAARELRKICKIAAGDNRKSLLAAQAATIDDSQLRALISHLATGGKNDGKIAEALRPAVGQTDFALRAAALRTAFLVKDEKSVRASIMTKGLVDAAPDLAELADDVKTKIFNLNCRLKLLDVIEATVALYQLASEALQRYRDNKAISGTLDFDDLIRSTRRLLASSESAAWVLYKLDGGLDHILVDEAQDTSPEQWDIVQNLAAEVFAGLGSRDVTSPANGDTPDARTVFAVGDEKQSIYSFQGAAPHMFAEVGSSFAERARYANAAWDSISLGMSFRTVAPVLKAVDDVFNGTVASAGVKSPVGEIAHTAYRSGQAGLVEIWEPERAAGRQPASPWQPLDDVSDTSPANRLANRIATRIRHWLDNGEVLKSQDRPIRAGDILILVRKRNPFARPMVAALKRAGIPVAGADRIRLTEQIAVQDLLALGDFLTLPEDDLALATVLKSPLFGLTDADLTDIAANRGNSALWKALLALEEPNEAAASAVATLKLWRKRADFVPPFEFFSSVLDRDGGRSKLLHRLGLEAADALDEFLDHALACDDAAAPSLTGFLAALRADESEVKRDNDLSRDEVRVMTVHGAKGLEAPIVFLPDTCSVTKGSIPGSRLITLDGGSWLSDRERPFVWPVKSSAWIDPISTAAAREKDDDEEERNRLLYVAMTRARDRIYVAGFSNKNTLPDTCWYTAIRDGLVGDRPAKDLGGGATGWRFESGQDGAVEKDKNPPRQTISAAALPRFASTPAPSEPQLSVPLAPSRLEPYGMSEDGEPADSDATSARDPAVVADHLSPTALADARRFLRGTLTHALLQHLPAMAPAQRRSIAERFVAERGAVLAASVRASIVNETLAVLDHPQFAPLFGPESRAEVAIAADLPRPPQREGKGPSLRLSGQIDRLAISGDDVLIVDYKTNRPPPHEVAGVAKAYLFQLAAYVLALQQLYPGKTIRTALLWTDGPRLMEIPNDVIDATIDALWSLDLAHLDGA